MDWLRQLRFRIFALFRRRALEADMAEELRSHLEQDEAVNRATGMSAEEAKQTALRGFGGVEQVKERARDERSVRWFEHLRQDLRHGVRILRHGD